MICNGDFFYPGLVQGQVDACFDLDIYLSALAGRLRYLERGELVGLLGEFGPPFAGLHLYEPRRQRQPPKLRALVEHWRTWVRNSAWQSRHLEHRA